MENRKKKWIIVIVVVFVLFFGGKFLITETNITKGIAYQIAENRLEKEHPTFGEISKNSISHGFYERLIAPKSKKRYYSILFYNGSGEKVIVEISAYPPFTIDRLDYGDALQK